WERDGVVVEEVVGPRDCLFCPPVILRGLRNDTDQPAFLQVLIDVTKPTLPHYPAGSVLEDLREKRQSAQQTAKAED
ncbi:MAG: cupin domain-containing protein, partial [Acidobacteriota bacterium]